jgi:2-succinyl-5-enolpyruvyl-6-hydroxy-3-cyclohexene-1-carboxylate synthase
MVVDVSVSDPSLIVSGPAVTAPETCATAPVGMPPMVTSSTPSAVKLVLLTDRPIELRGTTTPAAT